MIPTSRAFSSSYFYNLRTENSNLRSVVFTPSRVKVSLKPSTVAAQRQDYFGSCHSGKRPGVQGAPAASISFSSLARST